MQQKALLLTGKLSEPSGRFKVGSIDIPEPGLGFVLIEVHATALNVMDWKRTEFGLFVKEWPVILGFDAAGVVKKVGEGVVSIAIGDRVLHAGTVNRPEASTFQQYTIAHADFVAKVPSNVTLNEAATLPITLATTALGLYDKRQQPYGGLGLTPPWEESGRGKYIGEPIVVMAGATSVGQYAIQLARMSGFSPIITTASKSNEARLKSLGATHVIDRTLPLSSLKAVIQQITDQPVKYGFGAIATPEIQNALCDDALYDVIALGGQLVLVGQPAIDEKKSAEDKYIARVFADVQMPAQIEVGRGLYAHITVMLESGDIRPTKVEIRPGGLAGIPDGLQKLKKGVSAVKLVACPQETPQDSDERPIAAPL